MDNVSEIVSLLRKQADLEIAIMNDRHSARRHRARTRGDSPATLRASAGAERGAADGACLTTHAGLGLRAGRDGFRGIELGGPPINPSARHRAGLRRYILAGSDVSFVQKVTVSLPHRGGTPGILLI